jgi:hypothetical protein
MRTAGNRGIPWTLPLTTLERCAREHLTRAAASARFNTFEGAILSGWIVRPPRCASASEASAIP